MAAIDVTGAGAGISLTKDIFVNNSLIGPFDSTSDIEVFLEDTGGNPITPVSSVLVGNDLTITANIPNPSGVALQRPTPTTGISYYNYDTGWRAQNGWYSYTPPTYPAKFSQLDTTLGANQRWRLKTALTVNGVSSTERFVDINGVQSWGALNNANYAVIDKLTGLMYTRTFIGIASGSANWIANMTTAFNFSITITGNSYTNWYMVGMGEFVSLFGLYLGTSSTVVDPISSNTIFTGVPTSSTNPIVSADPLSISPGAGSQGYLTQNTTGGNYANANTNVATNFTLWVHDASNLIS